MFVDMNHTTTGTNGLTVQAAAARAGVDTTTIREAIGRGELPATPRTTLTVQPADVDAWSAGSEDES